MKNSENKCYEILQSYLSCGMITSDVLEQLKNNMNKKLVLEKHNYKITSPTREGGRYMTYIFDTVKNQRQKITSYSEKGLYQKLYEFYYPTQKESLQSLYPGWLEKRKHMQISDSTIHRNQNNWDKYYLNAKIIYKPIDRITVEDIEGFFYECISKHHLTRKALNNMKLILKELMKLAKKKELISTNDLSTGE